MMNRRRLMTPPSPTSHLTATSCLLVPPRPRRVTPVRRAATAALRGEQRGREEARGQGVGATAVVLLPVRVSRGGGGAAAHQAWHLSRPKGRRWGARRRRSGPVRRRRARSQAGEGGARGTQGEGPPREGRAARWVTRPTVRPVVTRVGKTGCDVDSSWEGAAGWHRPPAAHVVGGNMAADHSAHASGEGRGVGSDSPTSVCSAWCFNWTRPPPPLLGKLALRAHRLEARVHGWGGLGGVPPWGAKNTNVSWLPPSLAEGGGRRDNGGRCLPALRRSSSLHQTTPARGGYRFVALPVRCRAAVRRNPAPRASQRAAAP